MPWLLGQIIPNRLVPDPDPTRRRLVISYDLAPAEFPRRFHRSATYDDAVAALAFLTIGDRDRAAFTLHALARLVRPDGSLWFGYNTANDGLRKPITKARSSGRARWRGWDTPSCFT